VRFGEKWRYGVVEWEALAPAALAAAGREGVGGDCGTCHSDRGWGGVGWGRESQTKGKGAGCAEGVDTATLLWVTLVRGWVVGCWDILGADVGGGSGWRGARLPMQLWDGGGGRGWVGEGWSAQELACWTLHGLVQIATHVATG